SHLFGLCRSRCGHAHLPLSSLSLLYHSRTHSAQAAIAYCIPFYTGVGGAVTCVVCGSTE
ncbi:unnamed protein product, partial [Tilletia laevis]